MENVCDEDLTKHNTSYVLKPRDEFADLGGFRLAACLNILSLGLTSVNTQVNATDKKDYFCSQFHSGINNPFMHLSLCVLL